MKKKKSSTGKSAKKDVAKESLPTDGLLTGWPKIAKYLGQPVSIAQRWAKNGMPVERKGRNMTARPEELSKWLGRESGTQEAVHITQTSDEDLLRHLRLGLKEVRKK